LPATGAAAAGGKSTKRLGLSMRAVLADRCDTDSYYDDFDCGIADDAASSDRMSSRGLEILRILNDVFNGLPTQTAAAESTTAGHVGEIERRSIRG
jgi:hypothetical protein